EDGVEQRRGVTLGEDEAVALRPGRVFGVVPHDAAEVQGDGDLDARQRAGRVAGAGGGGAGDDVAANGLGLGLQLGKRGGGGCWHGGSSGGFRPRGGGTFGVEDTRAG